MHEVYNMHEKTIEASLSSLLFCFPGAFLILYCLGIDSLFQDKLFMGLKGSLFSPPSPLGVVCCAVPGVCFCASRGPAAERKRQRM